MRKTVIILLTIVLIGLVGGIGYKHFIGKKENELENYYNRSEIYLSKNTKYANLPSYFNFEGIEYEKITLKELKNRIGKYEITCGLENVNDFSDDNDCLDVANDYIMYIDNGIPFFIHSASECDGTSCVASDNYYDVAKFEFIKNVKSVISKIDQYNGSMAGSEFAFQLENGDVYYFTPLFDEKIIDGEEKYAHLLKVELPSKLKKFSNVENGQITYGTDIVLELENKEKYVLLYSYETNNVSLEKYSDYYKKYHEFDDSTELSGDEEIVKLSTEVIKSDKLNSIIKNNKFVAENYDDQDYDGICPQITVKIDNKTLHFHVLQIANTKVFLYADNDRSDGRAIEIYGIDEETLYYAKFLTIDYEDPTNHSLILKKYDIDNIESIALIKATTSKDMLDGRNVVVPYNYVLIKTKNEKYYTDFMYNTDTKTILREVIQK